MNLIADLRALVLVALDGLIPDAVSRDAVRVDPPRDAAHGDLMTNAAMVLAAPAGLIPRAVATTIAERLQQDARIARAVVAGPGFVNLHLAPGTWAAAALAQVGPPAIPAPGSAGRALVEFVSAYPTAPLSAATARAAVHGDALCNLLARCGHAVTREYYVNDGGAQADALAREVFPLYLALCRGAPVADAAPLMGEIAAQVRDDHGTALVDCAEADWLPPVRRLAVAAMLARATADLAALGVGMDSYVSEQALRAEGRIDDTIARLTAQDLIYHAAIETPEESLPDGWTPPQQMLFRASAYGDSSDRPVRGPGGGWTYFATDLAYHCDKVARGFDLLIDIVGPDHRAYAKRLQAAVAACSGRTRKLEVAVVAPLATPEGAPDDLRGLVARCGGDALRLAVLAGKPDAILDPAALEAADRGNPAFAIPYAHACAVQALADAGGDPLPADASDIDLPRLDALQRQLAFWPHRLEQAATLRAPARIAQYLDQLAALYLEARDPARADPPLAPGLRGGNATDSAKIALTRAVQVVLAEGLSMLGVNPPEEMR